jgi:glycine/D-amino acid oxidase-like deaminating enzyme
LRVSLPDVAIIGGGIVGAAAAYFLAEAGAKTAIYERDGIAAGASGRNAGNIGRPFDTALVPLYQESLRHYLWLSQQGLDFSIPSEAVGLLLVSRDRSSVKAIAADVRAAAPEVGSRYLEGSERSELEPILAADLAACWLDVGHPTVPGSATRAFAMLAERHGADVRLRSEAVPWVEQGRARGVMVDGERHPAGSVVVAAGAWTSEAIDPQSKWRPIQPLWGVIVDMRLPSVPRHVIEEATMVQVFDPRMIAERQGYGPVATETTFSLVTAEGRSALGATFSKTLPNAHVQ